MILILIYLFSISGQIIGPSNFQQYHVTKMLTLEYLLLKQVMDDHFKTPIQSSFLNIVANDKYSISDRKNCIYINNNNNNNNNNYNNNNK